MKVTGFETLAHPNLGALIVAHVEGLTEVNGDPVPVIWISPTSLPNRRVLYGRTTEESEDGCTCGVCEVCTWALEMCLAEQFARCNPDRLGEMDAAAARAIVKRGGVQGKVWCDECETIEADGHHATAEAKPPKAPKAVGAFLELSPR